jgi:hypothetical protein
MHTVIIRVSYIREQAESGDGNTVITVERPYLYDMIDMLNQNPKVVCFYVGDGLGVCGPEDLGFSSEHFQKWRR